MSSGLRLNPRIVQCAIFCVLAEACAYVQASPLEIPLVLRDGARVAGNRIADYPSAFDAILQVLVDRFALPIPARYVVEIYPAREEFEAALVGNLKMKPAVARTTATFAKAAVGNRKVLVNEMAMAELDWPQRVLTLAHELVHTTQLELAGHRSLVRYQWLVEGFAEWIAFHVVDSLGIEDLAAARARMAAEVREVRRSGPLPELRQLDSLEDWITARNARGFKSTYPLSFLVMDYLVERHSLPKVADYFRHFRSSGDPVASFSAAFGEDLGNFQGALDRHLAKLLD